MILDGWGLSTNPKVSAIDQAKTPFVDALLNNYPHSKLEASGLQVGLPAGQMGNSEVGHMNIGAGRIVYQDLVKINKAVQDGDLEKNAALLKAFQTAQNLNKKVHFIGLLSNGGVHSHIDHLKALTTLAAKKGLEDVFIHAFLDGRDTDPKGGIEYIKELGDHLEETTGEIASVIGRYYAMDRDNRWERVKLAYDAMVNGTGELTQNISESIMTSYADNITDEFLTPLIKSKQGQPLTKIEAGDVVICFNFRTDRGRQISQALTQKDFPEQEMSTLDIHYVTMTSYDDSFDNVEVVFEKDNLKNTLGEILSKKGKNQIRIAETEKYPHVTFFFSGGRETEFEGEKRILCPSPKVATYDLMPEMSAHDIKSAIIQELKKGEVDFTCLNFANPDMVGHTGDFQAAIKACETVDTCTKEVIETALAEGYTTIVIADHGNPDMMINDDGSPNTAHTTNLVPCILVDNEYYPKMKDGKLGDLAPTILELMGIDIPQEMTGDILLQ